MLVSAGIFANSHSTIHVRAYLAVPAVVSSVSVVSFLLLREYDSRISLLPRFSASHGYCVLSSTEISCTADTCLRDHMYACACVFACVCVCVCVVS